MFAALTVLACGLPLTTARAATGPTSLPWRLENSTQVNESASGGAFFADADTLWEQAFDADAGGTLVNGTTDAQTPVPASGCEPAIGGGPFLVLDCDPADPSSMGPVAYNTTSGQSFVPDQAAADATCHAVEYEECTPMTVGAEWIQLDRLDSGDVSPEHSQESYLYENIRSGSVRAGANDPGGRTWDDLNTAGLTHQLCAPLRVPVNSADSPDQSPGTFPGPIQFYGPFAALVSVNGEPSASTVLEECGHKLSIPIADGGEMNYSFAPPPGNRHVVVWIASNRTLSYIQLPSLQRGSWKLPMALTDERGTLVLAGDRLFLRQNTLNPNQISSTIRTFSAVLPAADR